jgi:hypothetical protein
MAYQFTVTDAKNSPIKNISGVCSDSSQFRAYLNEAIDRLLTCGNWFDTEQLIKVALYNACITWPRYVQTVLGVRMCGWPVDLRNRWYTIAGPARDCCGAAGLSGFANYPMIRDIGESPLYRQITGTTGKLIRAVVIKREDVGKVIRIFGFDQYNQPLQTKNAAGVWEDGIPITLSLPYAQTTVFVTKITSVLKEATQGRVMLYEFDATALLRDIAMYEPGETNPRYRQSHFDGAGIQQSGCETTAGDKYRCVDALVKLAYIPVVNDDDFLLIDDWTALKFMIQAIKLEEAGDTKGSSAFEQKAIRQMNLRDRNTQPNAQTTIMIESAAGMIYNPI